MNRHKLNYTVEYIRTQAEFPFDVLDVEEDLNAVLAYFGLHPELDDEERQELCRDLFPLASEAELSEIARLVDEAAEHELCALYPGLYVESVMRRPRPKSVPCDVWLKQMCEPHKEEAEATAKAVVSS
jgi:hypothetical protein